MEAWVLVFLGASYNLYNIPIIMVKIKAPTSTSALCRSAAPGQVKHAQLTDLL